ncbi:hypothetical protein METP1_02642 [Methanosarcinales archaeon]|nr:hypothetical protein METP1_02642 [Methanosarcinales archaeon]
MTLTKSKAGYAGKVVEFVNYRNLRPSRTLKQRADAAGRSVTLSRSGSLDAFNVF